MGWHILERGVQTACNAAPAVQVRARLAGVVNFFHAVGLDYVSCSPFRVPVARLEAARAAVSEKGRGPSPDAR